MALRYRKLALNVASACLVSCGSISSCIFVIGSCNDSPKRTLVGESHLGMELYGFRREEYLKQLSNAGLTLPNYVKMITNDMRNSKFVANADDLTKLLYIADTPAQCILAVSLLKKLALEQNDVHSDSIARIRLPKFGPLTMRLFHWLRLPKQALTTYHDPSLTPVFTNVTAATILLDLLYETARYNEVIEVYDRLHQRSSGVTFVFAASCHQIGTNEAFEKIRKVIFDTERFGRRLGERELCIASHLAIKHKQYRLVHDFERLSPRRVLSVNQVSLRILSALERFSHEEVVSLLEFMGRKFNSNSPVLPSDLADRISDLVKRLQSERDPLASRLDSVRMELAQKQQISVYTLESRLLRPLSDSHNRLASATRSNYIAPTHASKRPANFRESYSSNTLSYQLQNNEDFDNSADYYDRD